MNNENKSIHEFDLNLICNYFAGLERQGPGSPDVTTRALEFIDNLDSGSRIADLGCGTGGQTMTLARNTPGSITGIDLFPTFIGIFNTNAGKLGLGDRVKGITGSMDDLPFNDGELDLIWSEGAIYNIGFERGLREWRRYLRQGGFIAVTEASWFTETRPDEITRFWLDAYPGIDTVAVKVRQMQEAGYIPVATFILPETCWTDNFYKPQEIWQESFLRKHHGDDMAADFVANQRFEAQLYYRFREYYGYVFYIGKKF